MQAQCNVTYNQEPGRYDPRDFLGSLVTVDGTLTDESVVTRPGEPIVLIGTTPYVPAELAEHILTVGSQQVADWASAFGWRVQPPYPHCATCGAALATAPTFATVYCWEHEPTSQ